MQAPIQLFDDDFRFLVDRCEDEVRVLDAILATVSHFDGEWMKMALRAATRESAVSQLDGNSRVKHLSTVRRTAGKLTLALSTPASRVNFPGFSYAMAFAIIKTGGRQHRVTEGDIIDVDLLDLDPGKEAVFGEVVMHADADKLTHGTPMISGATVTGEVIEQRKDKKVIAFKYRRRKGYHRTVGHRRKLTRVKITGIKIGSEKTASKPKLAE